MHRLRRLLVLSIAAACLTWGALELAPRLFEEGGSPTEEAPAGPAGFWHLDPAIASGESGREPTAKGTANGDDASAEARARLISLPYLSGRARAAGDRPRGVVLYDPERALDGLNLYNSGHAPEAILMDMAGKTIHRWRYPFERAFPHVRPTTDTAFFRRVKLLPGGTLAALYQTGGLVFLDRRSRLLGRCRGNFYNDFWLGDDGTAWTLAKSAGPLGTSSATRLDDFLVELRVADGGRSCEEVRRFSITRAFERSDFAALLHPMAPGGDVLHSNTVARIEHAVAGAAPAFAPGNLLISLREVDVVAVVDPASERVVWAQRGPWRGQHEPSLLASGKLLLFDNRGGPGGSSRLVEVDTRSGKLTWVWPPEPDGSDGPDGPDGKAAADGHLESSIGGSCARLANGDTLVTESVPGRAFELDPEGEIVWDFETPHRAGPEDSLVAMLFEVQRVPRDSFEVPPA